MIRWTLKLIFFWKYAQIPVGIQSLHTTSSYNILNYRSPKPIYLSQITRSSWVYMWQPGAMARMPRLLPARRINSTLIEVFPLFSSILSRLGARSISSPSPSLCLDETLQPSLQACLAVAYISATGSELKSSWFDTQFGRPYHSFLVHMGVYPRDSYP